MSPILKQKEKHLEINGEEEEQIEFKGKVDKQTISMDLLSKGYIQSFIDFFYVTTKIVVQEDQQLIVNTGQEEQEKELDEKGLLQLQEDLINGEKHIRLADKIPSLNDYLELAKQFYDKNDVKTSAYFYKRVIEISKLIKNKDYEVKAKLGQGQCLEELGKTEEAIKLFEESLLDAEQFNYDELKQKISDELIHIYEQFAEIGEIENEKEALFYYEKCLEVSKKTGGDISKEGEIAHKIGLLHFKSGEYEKSIQFQNQYLMTVKNEKANLQQDVIKQRQMEAFSALAKAYLKLNEMDSALDHLKQYYEKAKEIPDNNAISDAALHLAQLYQRKNNIPESLKYFQEHFDAARTQKGQNISIISYYLLFKEINRFQKVGPQLTKQELFQEQLNQIVEQKYQANFIQMVKNSDKEIKTLLDYKQQKKDK